MRAMRQRKLITLAKYRHRAQTSPEPFPGTTREPEDFEEIAAMGPGLEIDLDESVGSVRTRREDRNVPAWASREPYRSDIEERYGV
jgi:hypothetical protein